MFFRVIALALAASAAHLYVSNGDNGMPGLFLFPLLAAGAVYFLAVKD